MPARYFHSVSSQGRRVGQAWVWLGAAAQATRRVPIGTAVTPPGSRYHPALIAQGWATLELSSRPYRAASDEAGREPGEKRLGRRPARGDPRLRRARAARAASY